MASYMTIFVLALAASNVSAVLSAPVHPSREVREQTQQSLSHREDPLVSSRPVLSGNSVQPAHPPTGPEAAEPPKKAEGKGNGVNGKQLLLNFFVGITSSLFASSIFEDMTLATTSAPATKSNSTASTRSPRSAATQSPQFNSTLTNLTPRSGQTQNEYGQYPNQQRAVDHGKRDDFFEAKARSTVHLFGRADLEEALKPIRRVLDELD